MAPQIPNPHEVPLESLHGFQSSGNHSVFCHSQYAAQFTSVVEYIVFCFRVISVQLLKILTVLEHKVGQSLS
jgi:hypothetical protein